MSLKYEPSSEPQPDRGRASAPAYGFILGLALLDSKYSSIAVGSFLSYKLGVQCKSVELGLQGYLAHKKQPPP